LLGGEKVQGPGIRCEMDNTKSTFEGQPFAKSNREKRRNPAQMGNCPGVFGAVRWLGWLAKTMPDLSERARLVTLVLVELSARNDVAFPSLRWLALHLGCSTNSVRQAIREAEQSGLVRRGERFDHRDFSGGRQTSNRYEIVLHPGLELVEVLGLAEDRDLVIVDDEADPNQLELSVEDQPQAQRAPQREAARPALANVRPRVTAPVATAPQNESRRPPLLDSIAPPSQPEQGVKDLREKKEEKANSTRAREERTGGGAQSAAAFLGEVLPDEKARELKLRFGHNAFGGLLFAMRRNICREHPRLVKRALERLRVASDVANPGGYFFRVFQDELAAAELAGPPSAEDLRAETEREQRAALQQRARRLKEQLEQVACVDFGAADRIRAELEQIYAQLRAPSAAKAPETSPPASRPPAPMPAPRARPATVTPASLTPDLADAIAAAEEALAIVRGKAPSSTREPLPGSSRAA
jgi:hypothetical protein